MIKLILSDIDGTFLTNDKKTPKLHAEALEILKKRGIEFAFVSARMPEAIYPITDALKMPHTAVISYSGGLVLTADEKVLFDKKMPLDDAKNIFSAMKTRWNDISLNFYTGRRWFVEKFDANIEREAGITEAPVYVKKFDDLLAENVSPNKIMVICAPETCKEMETVLSGEFSALNVVRSAPHLLEIMDKSVSKATGIEILLKHYGIALDEAIAFGDNYNDTEMLNLIPQSVAMANSPDEIKKIASAVTDSNENGGIYTYLAKIGVI